MSRLARTLIATCAVTVLACAVGTAGLASVAHAAPRATAGRRACASYPRPGTVATRRVATPAAIRRRYGLFREPRRARDRLDLRRLAPKLQAAGIVRAGIRYLGTSGDHGRLYAIPALHYLPYRIAPARCLSVSQRGVERYLRPSLRKDYAQPAICVAEVGGDDLVATPLRACAGLAQAPAAMLGAGGTPLLGLAPNGITAVTASYLSAPPRTVRVHHNFYEIVDPRSLVTPCSTQWLDRSGNVTRAFQGCDYLPAELPQLRSYRAYVSGALSTVRSQVAALAQAINSGSLAAARSAWLTARVSWLEIGQDDGAYGCFGQLGREIDGTAAGLPGATASSRFTGFHRIELDLWGEHRLDTAAADTTTLQRLLGKLIAVPLTSELPGTQTGVANWVLRPHEVLEDALRDTLSGDDDYGSGTGLAAVSADVRATRRVLTLLAPVLKPLAPRLVGRARTQLNAVMAAIESTRSGGNWVGVRQLSTSARERVDATADAALETLAPVPDLLTSTGHSAPPT